MPVSKKKELIIISLFNEAWKPWENLSKLTSVIEFLSSTYEFSYMKWNDVSFPCLSNKIELNDP